VDLANLGSESETCVGSRVRLVVVSISFEKNFYRLPFTPPSPVRRIGPSTPPSLVANSVLQVSQQTLNCRQRYFIVDTCPTIRNQITIRGKKLTLSQHYINTIAIHN
jgi:hypothetical protein